MEEKRVGKYCEVCDGRYCIYIRYNYSDACEYVQVYDIANSTCVLYGTFGIDIHGDTAGYSTEANRISGVLNYVSNIIRETMRWREYWTVAYEAT